MGVLKEQLDSVTWKLAEQQAEIFRLNRELQGFKMNKSRPELELEEEVEKETEKVEQSWESVFINSDDIKTEMMLAEEEHFDVEDQSMDDYLTEED